MQTIKEKAKNPDRVKGGKARWAKVPKQERKEWGRKNGVKGANALWSKIRAMQNELDKNRGKGVSSSQS